MNVKIVMGLRNNIKKRVNVEELAAGLNKRKIIEKAVADELAAILDSGVDPKTLELKKGRPNVVRTLLYTVFCVSYALGCLVLCGASVARWRALLAFKVHRLMLRCLFRCWSAGDHNILIPANIIYGLSLLLSYLGMEGSGTASACAKSHAPLDPP